MTHVSTANFVGVDLADLLEETGVRPVAAAMDRGRGAVLAIGMNGEPLKWVTDLEVTTRQANWLKRGWGREAPIKTESRIDTSKGFETVPSGKVCVAGIAWAQHAGVAKVEVCRETDKSAYTQTEMRAGTVPDGATGWHSIAFTAQ